jgi:succinyl-diaminopimelate desuccinylase
MIPGVLEAQFNLRFSNALSEAVFRERIESVLRERLTDWDLRWSCNAHPFLSPRGRLTETVSRVVEQITNRKPAQATDGGTSDARFIAPTGAEVVEFGLVGASGHQVDESVCLAELETLATIYQEILLTLGREPVAEERPRK